MDELKDWPKVPVTKITDFVRDFHSRRFPEYRYQRLGQAFVNKFFPIKTKPCSELFYEEDTSRALHFIFENLAEL